MFCFVGFSEDSWDTRLYLLQEAIARKFGFIPLQFDATFKNCWEGEGHNQYVHMTGYQFIMISSPKCRNSSSGGLDVNKKHYEGNSKQSGSLYYHNKPRMVSQYFIFIVAIHKNQNLKGNNF